MMKPDEFKKMIEIYSADLARWPKHLVKPALALVEKSAEAKACFDAALKLDDTLRSWQPSSARLEGLERKILEKIQAVPQEREGSSRFSWRPVWIFAPVGSLVAAAVLGFIIGFSPVQQSDYLLDPVFYSQDQIIGGDDIDSYTGSMF